MASTAVAVVFVVVVTAAALVVTVAAVVVVVASVCPVAGSFVNHVLNHVWLHVQIAGITGA